MNTKEQIKIHGVDVRKCQHYNKNIKMDCLLYPLQPDSCSKNPNCNFKQLARKTQECDTLKSQLDFEVQQKECLEQECEELKKQLKTSEKWRINAENLNEQLALKNAYYFKALEEIEAIANVLITETNEYSKCCHKDMCGESDVSKHKKIEKTVPCPYGNVAYCQYDAVDNILTIIKELKGE